MAITVTMPQLGETVTEGTILSWAKQPGDTIAEDEVLLEISTDKVDTEVPSPAAGVIQEILVAEGETVSVGEPLVIISEPGEAAEAADTAGAEPEPSAEATDVEPLAAEDESPSVFEPEPAPGADSAATPSVAPAPSSEAPRRGILSPVVRKLAAERSIDLEMVPGSGEGGRITRKDVMAFIASADAAASTAQAAEVPQEPVVDIGLEGVEPSAPAVEPVAEPVASAPAAPPPEAAPAKVTLEPAPPPVVVRTEAAQPSAVEEPAAVRPAAAAPPVAAEAEGDRVVELSRLRRRIAQNLARAKASAAHVWASIEVDYEGVERVRAAHRAAFKEREGFSLTYLPFVARATMDALNAYPLVNSSFLIDEGRQIFHSRVNLGIAVDMNQEGLVVVTVKNASDKRLSGLAREIRALAGRARDGDLEPDDISGSTFTITNPGPFGSYQSAPIINVPNVAILSTDTVKKRPTVITLPDGTDSIAIHHIGYLGLSWDHRAFDGSTAVLFLGRIKENLETWDWEQELS